MNDFFEILSELVNAQLDNLEGFVSLTIDSFAQIFDTSKDDED